MKDNEKFYDIERKIRSLPKPDYDKKFTKETQDIIHQNLLQFARSYGKKKRRAGIMKKISVGLATVAALVLFSIFTLEIYEDRLSSSNSNEQGQQSEESTAIDDNKVDDDKEISEQEETDKDEIEQNETDQTDKDSVDQDETDKNTTDTILYENTEYGFTFTLPISWKDYQIVSDSWEGISTNQQPNEQGPTFSIRHPEWTEETPKQDIPIMILTLNQWSLLEKGEFHIGAAPVGPTMLGQNNEYVFALPARYNYAFLEGYEEVENILENKPLQPKNVER
jgi:hypothetical protein